VLPGGGRTRRQARERSHSVPLSVAGRPDRRIHRHGHVPNLQVFFRRRGAEVAATRNPRDYAPGDLVTWMLPGNLPHIGIVTGRRTPDGERPMIVHNIGNGPELEDMLWRFPITTHFRYRGQ